MPHRIPHKTEDNMKKILAMILVLVLAASFAGCATTGTKSVKATDPTNLESISYKDYDNSLLGLCNYLDDLGYMVFDYNASSDEAGEATIKMNAELIGAETGYKSTYKYDNVNWVVEVYYYKDTNSEDYKEAQTGKFTFDGVEDGTFDITVNNSYAIVVTGPDGGEEREKAIVEAFNNFYPDGQ